MCKNGFQVDILERKKRGGVVIKCRTLLDSFIYFLCLFTYSYKYGTELVREGFFLVLIRMIKYQYFKVNNVDDAWFMDKIASDFNECYLITWRWVIQVALLINCVKSNQDLWTEV